MPRSLDEFDKQRSLSLEPARRQPVRDRAILRLARTLEMPQLLSADAPVAGANPLLIPSPAAFLAWIQTSPWGARLEIDLQLMSAGESGQPRLTSWLAMDEFAKLAADAADALSTTASEFGRWPEAAGAWAALGVETVYLCGHLATH